MREDHSGAWTLLTFSPLLQAKPSEMSDLIELHLLGQFFDFSMVMLSILPCPSARQPQDPIFSSCSPVRHPCIINYFIYPHLRCWQPRVSLCHCSTRLITWRGDGGDSSNLSFLGHLRPGDARAAP